MRFSICLLALILVAPQIPAQECSTYGRYEGTINCKDSELFEFPDFSGFIASTYMLSGNHFDRLTKKTFPTGFASNIEITRNSLPIKVDNNAFDNLKTILNVLKLQNVEFNFDEIFAPVVGLTALNNLELGCQSFVRDLSLPFLDKDTLNRLIWLSITKSGINNIQTEALDSEFRRLRHLRISHNRLRFIPEGVQKVMTISERKVLEIDLSYNLLDTLEPEWLPAGCTITILDLSYNNIHSVRRRALDNCPHLVRLDLTGNSELLYLSSNLFPNNCHFSPPMEVHLQHTGIRNVEFALRSCVGQVIFWNTSVPCSCGHQALLNCKRHPSAVLIGDCVWHGRERLMATEVHERWSQSGCAFHGDDEVYGPSTIPDAGDSLASIKDWGECDMYTVTTTTTQAIKPRTSTPDITTITSSPTSTTTTSITTTIPTTTTTKETTNSPTKDSTEAGKYLKKTTGATKIALEKDPSPQNGSFTTEIAFRDYIGKENAPESSPAYPFEPFIGPKNHPQTPGKKKENTGTPILAELEDQATNGVRHAHTTDLISVVVGLLFASRLVPLSFGL